MRLHKLLVESSHTAYFHVNLGYVSATDGHYHTRKSTSMMIVINFYTVLYCTDVLSA
jgi:hypothetical protein